MTCARCGANYARAVGVCTEACGVGAYLRLTARGQRLLNEAAKPARTYPAPTGDGLWCAVAADGTVGWPVEISMRRREGGMVRFTVSHHGTEAVDDELHYHRARWVPYRAPRVTL